MKPLFQEALKLGQAAALVYSVLWEAAWHDQRGNCGGTTKLSHKAIAALCHMGNATVVKATDALLDDGLISCLGLVDGAGEQKRWYRVIHPDSLEGQRHAISVVGVKPSEKAKALRAWTSCSAA